MWIETVIKGTFTTKKGDTMISFTATRDDGRNWAVPLWLVNKGLGDNVVTGTAVRIEVNGDRISRVQRDRHQMASASPVHSSVDSGMRRDTPRHSLSNTVLPYGFVPIDVDHAVTDGPVVHDGSSGGELLSGEILCELEALTPLLPGNARYTVDEAKASLSTWDAKNLPGSKQIVEPLRLRDGRVVIAGSALKGMIRQSLGALTSAPMERVGERHFTYRPNFGHADSPRYVCRPAVVDRQDGEEWIVKVLPGARDAFFRTGQKPADAVELIYRGGIDGKGILAASAPRPTYVYKKAWISSAKLEEAEECRISKSLLDAYLKTQCILSTDHINTSHPQSFDREKVEKAIKDATKIEPGQQGNRINVLASTVGQATRLPQ